MNLRSLPAAFAAVLLLARTGPAQVVINEIFYHGPEGTEDLEWIELHNAGKEPADISDWQLAGGVEFRFPPGSSIEPGAFQVVSGDETLFRRAYGRAPEGVFRKSLGNSGDTVELLDAQNRRVDRVSYRDSDPWPAAADGYSASLERITPSESGELPHNWAASPLALTLTAAGGTPGRPNASHSAVLPPRIENVAVTPTNPRPGDMVRVEATVTDPLGVARVELIVSEARPGSASPARSILMEEGEGDRYTASVPAGAGEHIARFSIRATNRERARRLFPAENDLRPAISIFVSEPVSSAGALPLAHLYRSLPYARLPQEGVAPAAGGGVALDPQRMRPGADPRRLRQPAAAPPRVAPPARVFSGALVPAEGLRGAPMSPRGNGAFVRVDPASGRAEVFDFVRVTPRKAGNKVRFHRDRPMDGMTTINLIFENNDRFVLAEPLAFELYRRAGNAASLTDFVRLSIDGRMAGYHLLVEQVNGAFLRRNGVNPNGDLYKINYFGGGVESEHEAQGETRGHAALTQLISALERSRGEAQWKIIQDNFNVEQVATYFAVNTCLSHWDGFFNNYFTYHDRKGSGKWEMYPWDQDKTWGFHDFVRPGEVFVDMPLTFGMEGDRPPGNGPARFNPGGGWWRPGGYFSKPLLANPQFRQVYLRRTREILEKAYTREVFFPIIDALADRLRPEVPIRAAVTGESSAQALRRFQENVASLKEHLVRRREFLLAQPEIQRINTP